jgi:putative iron-regulated protein
MKTKLWLGLGSVVLAGSLLNTPQNTPPLVSRLFGTQTAFANDGGEAGESGSEKTSQTYAISSTKADAFNYDAGPTISAYLDLVRSQYANAQTQAELLKVAVETMLADPNEKTLKAAQTAWIKARPSYLVTEAFRFYDGPIESLEGRINSWPLNEAAIDYVEGSPKAGIINGTDPITAESLLALNQKNDEADVTTGWHAIEFLLWGQDLSSESAGKREASDYVAGTTANDRRRLYLQTVTKQLGTDIKKLNDEWEATSAYSISFKSLEPREAIGRMLNGIAILAGHEFKSERLAVALDSGDQEDEHSCFSDTTLQDFVYDLVGIKSVWTGDTPDKQRSGLDDLVRSLDAPLARKIDFLLKDAEAKIAQLPSPWDKVLISDKASKDRQSAEQVVTALQDLANGFVQAGNKLGVLVLVPGN